MIKVLQLVVAVNDGGIEKLLYDYYSHMDTDKIRFDFAINDTGHGILEDKFKAKGSRIYRYIKFRKNFFKAVKDINKIIDEGDYDIIHSHLGNRAFLSLIHAKRKGYKVIISHSHSAYEHENFIQLLFRKLTTFITKCYSTHLFSCGEDAGKWMWGKKANYKIMKNAIQIERFKFDELSRKELRKELNIEGKRVLLCVGRLSDQKNQERLIDIFYDYQLQYGDAVLLLAGTGNSYDKIISRIKELKIEDKVKMLGARTDVNKLLSAADLYILTSKYEGLPISVVEAQCSGLVCVLSDAITKEVALSDYVSYCSLDSDNKIWVDTINDAFENRMPNRLLGADIVRKDGYDIHVESKNMFNFYNEAIKCD